MQGQPENSACVYIPPVAAAGPPQCLLAWPGAVHEQRFIFYDHIEIGRQQENRSTLPGMLLVADDTISRRHCVITQTPEGRCAVRDVSRNGTRLDGCRLVPNVETPLNAGQQLVLGHDFTLQLAAGQDTGVVGDSSGTNRTAAVQVTTVATVLVGDIRDYTALVRTAPSDVLQKSVGCLFERLTAEVRRHGGTVKEFQGDAIFAYWEDVRRRERVPVACQAALDLHALAAECAVDKKTWALPGAPLKVDWALATGRVVIDSFGGRVPAGLSMIGEAVVRAFRIEKLATDDTGPILACRATRDAVAEHFNFRDLGEIQPKGFDQPEHVFALLGPR